MRSRRLSGLTAVLTLAATFVLMAPTPASAAPLCATYPGTNEIRIEFGPPLDQFFKDIVVPDARRTRSGPLRRNGKHRSPNVPAGSGCATGVRGPLLLRLVGRSEQRPGRVDRERDGRQHLAK